MKKMNFKILIAVALLLVISLSSFAMLSFSLADENNGATLVSPDSSVIQAVTQIDRIVENSNTPKYGDKDPKDPNYNILEISSGSFSDLESICSVGGVFQTHVLDGYKTISLSMVDGTVNYIKKSSTTPDDELIAAIQDADLIYVHNDPNSMFDSSKGTDLSEAVKLALSSAATSDFKPFVIDTYKGTIDNIVSARKYNDLVTKVFKSNKAAYGWNKNGSTYISTVDFFNSSNTASTYLPIHGDDQNWLKLSDGTTTVAKVLTITSGSGSAILTDAMKADLTPDTITDPNLDPTGVVYKYAADGSTSPTAGFRAYAYFGNEKFPDYMQFFITDAGDLSSYNLDDFDFIVIEDNVNNVNISNADYTSLTSAYNSRIHILYSSSLKSSSTTGKTYPENPGPCYAYVLDKVATPTDTSLFDNVLLSNFSKMNQYASATNPKHVKEIADIIINGSYRGISSSNGGDDNSNVYTVLEIEPSYPIDTNLSKAFYEAKTYDAKDNKYNYKGQERTFLTESLRETSVLFSQDKHYELSFYYLRTNGVLDCTSDEISIDDGNTSLSSFDNNDGSYNYNDYLAAVQTSQKADTSLLQDYYKWTLSKAKIAHAVGKSYNQVKVVHMSSAEFNSSRVACADAYDAIYIGGDNSAIKAKSKWSLNGGKYNMYFADGDYGGQISTSTGTFRSNDISDNKKDELIKYAGTLPVIVDKTVVDAINNDEGVDPASNMYKVIKAFESGKYALYGFDSTKTIKIENKDEMYGTTYGGYVTVFNNNTITANYIGVDNTPYINNGNHKIDGTALSSVLKASCRPKLILTSMPKLYVETDSSTWITKDDFKWDYEITDSKGDIHASVFIDDNANGQFEESENRGNASGTKATLDPTGDPSWIGDDYFGPVYWKFVATDSETGASVSTTGISKIRRTTQKKMKVNLLQIIPCNATPKENDESTLFLCTECQMARSIVDNGNITTGVNQGKYSDHTLKQLAGRMGDDKSTPEYVNSTTKGILKLDNTVSDGKAGSATISMTGPSNNNLFVGGNPWENSGTTEITRGKSVTIDNLVPGRSVTLSTYTWNTADIIANSGSSRVVFSNGNTKTITVGADGIIEFTYPKQVSTSTTKEFISDYINGFDSEFDYSSHGNDLGIHSHKFGICKYDAHETRTQTKNGFDAEGLDELNSNWFLDFQNDYDVDTTIWSVEDYESYCKNVEEVYKNCKTSDDVITKRETFNEDATDYEIYYRCLNAVINGDYSTTKLITDKERTKFKDFLLKDMKLGATFDKNTNKLTYKTATDMTDVDTMLNAFAGSSGVLDNYLKKDSTFKVTEVEDPDTHEKSLKYTGDLLNGNKINCTNEQFKEEIDFYTNPEIKPSDRSYYHFFSLWQDTSENVTQDFARLYLVWRDAKILEGYFNWKYHENLFYSSVYYGDDVKADKLGKFKLDNSFNCICIGACDNFNGKDINKRGCEILEDYAQNNGSLILFHDSLVPSNVLTGGSNGTEKMSAILSDDFGQGAISDTATIGKGKYSLTQRSLMYNSMGHEKENYYKPLQKYNYSYFQLETNNQTKHGAHDLRDTVNGLFGSGDAASSNKANQINEGVITEYPFTIDSTLTISPTASSGYTANVDESEMVVYYTISGGNQGTVSAGYCADPNDGANNYFLYQYNNVTYTGAGHSLITGLGRENNDERRLFINVILNSARKSTAGPTLTLHDIDSTDDDQTNDTVIETHEKENGNVSEDAEEYKIVINSIDDLPTFTFRPVSAEGVKSIEIWYDVRCNGTEKNEPNYEADADGKKDIPIYYISTEDGDNLSNNHVGSKLVKQIHTTTGPVLLKGAVLDTSGNVTTTNLKLKEEYFTGRSGKCTYITVKFTDGKDRPVIKTIRIEKKPELIDLN